MTEQQRQAKQQLAERKPAGGRRLWPALVKRFPGFRRRSEGGQWRGDWPVVPPAALNEIGRAHV